MYELKGIIKTIKATEVISDKFKKREFVVTTDEKFPQEIAAQFTQDKCSLLDSYKVGQQVSVSCNIKGREWNGKHFINLEAWKIEGATAAQPKADPITKSNVDSFDGDDQGDLPF